MVRGGAYAAGKARQRGQTRQADEGQRLAALEQQSAAAAPAPAAPVAASGSGDLVGKLKELKELQDSGALTAEEFEVAKQKLLQSS
jgi:Short C-terminal domain